MKAWDAPRVAAAAGAELVRGAGASPPAAPGTSSPPGAPSSPVTTAGPSRAVIDSREVGPGDLFVGLPGSRVDGGAFAAAALEAGAWGVLVAPDRTAGLPGGGAVLAAADPLAALGALARAWRRELGAAVIAVTGSVGKTSTKDLITALIAPQRAVAASRANFNTDIGMPLEILAAPAGTEVLVLELAMRGFGQIAVLTEICEPDVGVITNIGPVHLEQVGSLEGVARAKAELLVGMRDGATAVVPAGEALLEPYLRPALEVVRFGDGGDVALDADTVVVRGERLDLELPFTARHQRINALAAVAAASAVGVRASGRVEVRFSGLRGERVALAIGATVINDCYNASPLSMRAALEDLASHEPAGRRVAVLGDMLELGRSEAELHREVGAAAASAGVDVLITVGPRSVAMLEAFDGESYPVADAGEAAALAGELIEPGDVVLVKASRGVGLEVVAEALLAADAPASSEDEPQSSDDPAMAGRPTPSDRPIETGPSDHHAVAGRPTRSEEARRRG
jgi:UDP-N-acetylmuramoyl-tripeptide--D-alanyl-D-alanine ligase